LNVIRRIGAVQQPDREGPVVERVALDLISIPNQWLPGKPNFPIQRFPRGHSPPTDTSA
jgi:hypothetical protein